MDPSQSKPLRGIQSGRGGEESGAGGEGRGGGKRWICNVILGLGKVCHQDGETSVILSVFMMGLLFFLSY